MFKARKARLEVALTYEGSEWVARGQDLTVRGGTLAALDERLAAALRDSGRFPAGERVTVFMGFDFDCIPTWFRQYAAHYFNRWVEMDL